MNDDKVLFKGIFESEFLFSKKKKSSLDLPNLFFKTIPIIFKNTE